LHEKKSSLDLSSVWRAILRKVPTYQLHLIPAQIFFGCSFSLSPAWSSLPFKFLKGTIFANYHLKAKREDQGRSAAAVLKITEFFFLSPRKPLFLQILR
jgi:hypothetical protein